MTITITKEQAMTLHNGKGITSVRKSASIKVGPNSLAQPCVAKRQHNNNLDGLCYSNGKQPRRAKPREASSWAK